MKIQIPIPKQERAHQVYSGVWVHVKCGRRVRLLESRWSDGLPFFAGFCPKCKHFFPLEFDE